MNISDMLELFYVIVERTENAYINTHSMMQHAQISQIITLSTRVVRNTIPRMRVRIA